MFLAASVGQSYASHNATPESLHSIATMLLARQSFYFSSIQFHRYSWIVIHCGKARSLGSLFDECTSSMYCFY